MCLATLDEVRGLRGSQASASPWPTSIPKSNTSPTPRRLRTRESTREEQHTFVDKPSCQRVRSLRRPGRTPVDSRISFRTFLRPRLLSKSSEGSRGYAVAKPVDPAGTLRIANALGKNPANGGQGTLLARGTSQLTAAPESGATGAEADTGWREEPTGRRRAGR